MDDENRLTIRLTMQKRRQALDALLHRYVSALDAPYGPRLNRFLEELKRGGDGIPAASSPAG